MTAASDQPPPEDTIVPPTTVHDIREGVLRRIERQAAAVRLAMFGAAAIESLMLMLALWLIDWRNRTHILLLVFSVLGYTIVLLGLVALGAHVSRASNRIIAVLDEALAPR